VDKPLEINAEVKKEEPKPKRIRYVSVRQIRAKGKSVLVEWLDKGDFRRAYVPPDAIKEDRINEELLEAAPQEGLDWRNYVTVTATPEKIERQLKRRGIWTEADLRANPQGIRQAFQEVYAPDMKELIERIQKEAIK